VPMHAGMTPSRIHNEISTSISGKPSYWKIAVPFSIQRGESTYQKMYSEGWDSECGGELLVGGLQEEDDLRLGFTSLIERALGFIHDGQIRQGAGFSPRVAKRPIQH
jgi:hypothetical protein